ncbi:MAG TPA: hypothetical protein VFU22_32910 [Roseiflexaceae bacterium]|nr:hypothetical protein [Roseiflexaceae bacterium]
MKTRIWLTLAGVALAVVVAIAAAPAAWAQGPADGFRPGPGIGPMTGGPGMGRMGGPQRSIVAVAADALGMTEAELVAQLQSGKTIAQVASEKNVALDTIMNAFVATRQARMAQAVAAGRMTQEQVDSMLATMRSNVTARLNEPWSPQGPGAGTGYADTDGDGVCDDAGSGRGGRIGEGRNQ